MKILYMRRRPLLFALAGLAALSAPVLANWQDDLVIGIRSPSTPGFRPAQVVRVTEPMISYIKLSAGVGRSFRGPAVDNLLPELWPLQQDARRLLDVMEWPEVQIVADCALSEATAFESCQIRYFVPNRQEQVPAVKAFLERFSLGQKLLNANAEPVTHVVIHLRVSDGLLEMTPNQRCILVPACGPHGAPIYGEPPFGAWRRLPRNASVRGD